MFHGFFSFRRIAQGAIAVVALAGLNSPALAHVGTQAAGLADGLAHPFSGLDHVLAMVAVGLWASQLGRPATWLLPLTFPIVMTLGALMGSNGMPLPWVEAGIGGSVFALGAMIAFALRPSVTASAAIIAVFALFHGYSHGVELPHSVSGLAYGAGFVAATLALHAVGLALGAWSSRPAGRLATRTAGATMAIVGALLLVTT